MRFDDEQHIVNYMTRKGYPKIHDDIFSQIKKYAPKGNKSIMELGSCLGLLAVRMIEQAITPQVVGLEINKKYINRALIDPHILYRPEGVSCENMPRIFTLLKIHKPDVIVSRRVFPEIAENGGGVKAVNWFGLAANRAGVRYIILEGRAATKNHTNPLWNADLEVEALAPHYKLIDSYKNVRVLEKVDG